MHCKSKAQSKTKEAADEALVVGVRGDGQLEQLLPRAPSPALRDRDLRSVGFPKRYLAARIQPFLDVRVWEKMERSADRMEEL